MTITAGAPELAQGYEALRAEALGLAPAARPRGRAVLIGAGLPAWMTALAPLARSPCCPAALSRQGRPQRWPGRRTGPSAGGDGGGEVRGMNSEAHLKVTASHLGRQAYLYVRQSTLRQVFENTESTKRQYALRDRAMALGWPAERVVVIDSDLGLSGSDSDREGFQRLVAAVGLGEVGVVLGLEVSRLARSSSDWHRLLEICALTDTLILDEDGIYNPAQFNDRLLLGLKGTMSEAELHVLRARLIGGQLAKASRGELEMKLPVGLVNDAAGHVVLDPDAQVQKRWRLSSRPLPAPGRRQRPCGPSAKGACCSPGGW